MDTESEVIQKACGDVLENVSKNRRHIIKSDYFDKIKVGEVSLKSPVKKLSDEEWQALTALWLTPRHRVCFFASVKETHVYCSSLYCAYFWKNKDISHLYIIVPICRRHV